MKRPTEFKLKSHKAIFTAKVLSWTTDYSQKIHLCLNVHGHELNLAFNSPVKMDLFYNYKEPAWVTDISDNAQYLLTWKEN